MKEFPKEINDYIREHSPAILRLAHSFIQYQDLNWSSYTLNTASVKFANSQSLLESLNLRGTIEHNAIVNTVSVLKHLCQALHGPQHLLEQIAQTDIGEIQIGEGKKISLHEESEALVRDLKNPIISYSKLLLEQASDYGWGRIPKEQLRTASGFAEKPIDIRANKLQENITPVHLEADKFRKSMQKINLKLKKATTILNSLFHYKSCFDHSYKVTAEYFPSLLSSEPSSDVKIPSLEDINTTLKKTPFQEVAPLLNQCRTEFDDTIKRSDKETPELRRMSTLIEAGEYQTIVPTTLHRLCIRHLEKNLYLESQKNLIRTLRLDENPNDIQRAMILGAVTAEELVCRALTICHKYLPIHARNPKTFS